MGYPDTQTLNRASQFAASGLTTTSTVDSGSTGVLTSTGAADWKFGAGLVKLVIDSGGPAYIQYNGNPASTRDYRLTSGDLLTDWYNIGVPVSGVSIAATSTGLNMRVGAWG